LGIPLGSKFKGTLDNIYVNFGNTLDTLPPAIPLASLTKSTGNNAAGVYSAAGRFSGNSVADNLLGNGDFSTNLFGNIVHWDSPIPDDSKWYVTSELYGKASQYTDGGNQCLRIAMPGMRYGGVAQIIDATAGQ
jgi:hypothetical protein